jgi:hypothetical protein
MAKFRSLLRATFPCPANLFCLWVMQGEALESHSVCSRFVLTPPRWFIVYTYLAKRIEAVRIHQATERPTDVFRVPAGPPEKNLSCTRVFGSFAWAPRM